MLAGYSPFIMIVIIISFIKHDAILKDLLYSIL